MTKKQIRPGIYQVVTPIGLDDEVSGVLPERYSIACFLKATNAGPLQI